MSFDIVVPTLGRSSLSRLLEALAGAKGPLPGRLILVDDRRTFSTALPVMIPERLAPQLEVLATGGAGPAAARNLGWSVASAPWVAFLDDDVVPGPDWLRELAEDLAGLGPEMGGSQGRIVVPLAGKRAPTDWEQSVKALEGARWATADMAYRRLLLAQLGGFDDRFQRAYREDADLALRAIDAGYLLARGSRWSAHPTGRESRWASLRRQAGNADDALMLVKHGRRWRERAGAPRGRRRTHLAITAAGALALGLLASGQRRLAGAAAGAWVAGTAEFVLRRVRGGPRTRSEVTAMVLTSVAIPPLASYQWVRGYLTARRRRLPAAVLFDRDGTLVEDVPYNRDPARVRPLPGARKALDRLRRQGVPIAIVSNQSAIARGFATAAEVEAVNQRVEDLLGPIRHWFICPHGPESDCRCRKPAPGLIQQAASVLGVSTRRCVVIGDIGADMEAARAAGARAVLIPTAATRREEIRSAPEVAADLEAAVDRILGRAR